MNWPDFFLRVLGVKRTARTPQEQRLARDPIVSVQGYKGSKGYVEAPKKHALPLTNDAMRAHIRRLQKQLKALQASSNVADNKRADVIIAELRKKGFDPWALPTKG